jgi:hypothetical protein
MIFDVYLALLPSQASGDLTFMMSFLVSQHKTVKQPTLIFTWRVALPMNEILLRLRTPWLTVSRLPGAGN